jgi:hypothetical protein
MVEVAAQVALCVARVRWLPTRRSWLPRCQANAGFTLAGVLASFTFVNI